MSKERQSLEQGLEGCFRKMTKEELMLIVYDSEQYSTKTVSMAEDVLMHVYGFSEKKLHAPSLFKYRADKKKGMEDLLMGCLKKMGIYMWDFGEADPDEDDGKEITVNYLGESFYIWFRDKYWNIQISKSIGFSKMTDSVRVCAWRKAANDVNWKSSSVICFDYLDGRCGRDVMTFVVTWIPFLPEIPNLPFFLHNVMKSMLTTEGLFRDTVHRLRANSLKEELARRTFRNGQDWEDSAGCIITPTPPRMTCRTKRGKTMKHLLRTLEKMECAYSIAPDGCIVISYEEVVLHATVDERSSYVVVHDYGWGHLVLDDIDEFSVFRRAANEVNWNSLGAVVFTIDRVARKVVVYCKAAFLFLPEIHDPEGYLEVHLHGILRAEKILCDKMVEIRQEDRKTANAFQLSEAT